MRRSGIGPCCGTTPTLASSGRLLGAGRPPSLPGMLRPSCCERRVSSMISDAASGGDPSPRNVLVTGGAGFIGSNFVRLLLQREPEVRVVNLDALAYAG